MNYVEAEAEEVERLTRENDELNRKVAFLSNECEVLIGFLIELKQWGSPYCRCSNNAHSLLERLRRGITTKEDI